jgi:hypothetical protein
MSGPGYPRRVRLSCRTPPAAASAPGHPRSYRRARRNAVSVLRRQTQDISRPTLRMHFEHFRCEMPGFYNATRCLHQVSKLTAGRYHLATAFTYQGTIEVRRTMSPIGTKRKCRGAVATCLLSEAEERPRPLTEH